MRRLMLATMLAAAMTQVASSAASRTETQPYTLGQSSISICGGHKELANANQHTVEGDVPNVGGGCFTVKPADTRVGISIQNDLGARVGGSYHFSPNPEPTRRNLVSFCGTASVVIPSWAEYLYVYPDPASASTDVAGTPVGLLGGCSAPASVSARGTITVTFS